MTDVKIDSCRFCGKLAEEQDAIESCWVPSFYLHGTETEIECPVCSHCVEAHLQLAEDLEWEMKAGHDLPEDIN